jgi:hypothetical protein
VSFALRNARKAVFFAERTLSCFRERTVAENAGALAQKAIYPKKTNFTVAAACCHAQHLGLYYDVMYQPPLTEIVWPVM